MKNRSRFFYLLILSIFFTSCFNGLKTPKETIVSFQMDKATVQKIIELSESTAHAARAGEASDSQPEETFYIEVTLCGDEEQTKTATLTKEIKIDFENIPVNARVYAKAQIYKYTDSKKSEKEVIYRGESNTITVRDGTNLISIKLKTAQLTVTFETNGGSVIEPVKVITGTPVEEPANPVKPEGKKQYSKENYAFAGWYTDPELTKAYNFYLPVTDDLTLYAKWLPDFVFVEGATVDNYLTAGRSLRISDLFVSDHEVTQAEYFEITGKNPSNHTVTEIEDYPVENVTWFDALKYCNLLSIKEGLTPCYKINDSENPEEWGTFNSQTAVVCSLAANGYRLPTEAEWEYVAAKSFRSNVSFGDIAIYSENSKNSTQTVDNRKSDELCLNSILGNVAEWCFDVYSTSIPRSTGPTGPMIVSGADNNRVVRGGSYQSTQEECSATVRASANPTEKSPAIGFRVVRTVVYEYKILTNKVTFDTKGGSAVEVQVIVNGDTATQPANPSKTGYDFNGWIISGTDESFNFSTQILQDITLEAKWTPTIYTISYDLAGGSDSTPNPTTYTIETETFELNIPVKNLYNFKGWYNGSQKVTKIEKGSYGNLSLVASWTQCHIVRFDKQDGSTADEQEVENNDTATAPTDPERTGFTFVHWYDATGSENTAFDFTTQITGNVTLKALWQYKVIYDSSGGTDVTTQEYKHTQAVTAPANPTRTGFDFDCWCENSANGPEYTFGSASTTGNITLYARWKYTVTYEAGNGESPTVVEKIHTAPVTAPTESPSWSTMTFVCWCSDSNLTTEYTFGYPSENGNITLYAKWKYLITFDTQGAGTIPQQWVIYPNAPVEPDPAPSKDHFEFEYWCTNLSDPENTKYNFDTPYITNDRTLHAKFKTINENLGGINVSFGVETGDIAVTKTENETTITCAADSGYTEYSWFLDNDEQLSYHNQSTCIITKPTNPGVYDIYLEAVKDGVTYTWTQQFTVTN